MALHPLRIDDFFIELLSVCVTTAIHLVNDIATASSQEKLSWMI